MTTLMSPESDRDMPKLNRPMLYVLVGSVVLGAVVGITIVLRDEWGSFEVRVILTTITIAVASLCGLACDFSRTPRGTNLQPQAGFVLTLISASMILGAIWPEFHSELYLKTTAIVSIFAVATVHVSLLSMARLARRFAWVYLVAIQVIYGVAIILAAMIVLEPRDEEKWIQIIAVASIADAALTMLIPLLHRISKSDADWNGPATALDERNAAAIDQEISRLRHKITALERLRCEIAGEPTEGESSEKASEYSRDADD